MFVHNCTSRMFITSSQGPVQKSAWSVGWAPAEAELETWRAPALQLRGTALLGLCWALLFGRLRVRLCIFRPLWSTAGWYKQMMMGPNTD
jgi:hypothetical protein